MRVVPDRLFAGIHEILSKRYDDVDAWFRDVGVEPSPGENADTRIPWDKAVLALNEFYVKLDESDEAMIRLGSQLLSTQAFAPSRMILAQLDRAVDAHRSITAWLGPFLFPAIERKVDTVDDRTLSITFAVPSKQLPCRVALLLEIGLHKSAPLRERFGETEVDYRFLERGAQLMLQTPKLLAASEDKSSSQLSRASIMELIRQQRQLRDSFRDVTQTSSLQGPEASQLDSLVSIGQEIAQKRDLQQIAESVLRIVVDSFGCTGGEIQLRVWPNRKLSWGLGDREGTHFDEYDLTTENVTEGWLRLWGTDWKPHKSEEDPVAALLPWINVAFDNAMVFRRLEQEKQLSDGRAKELEKARIDAAERNWQYRQLVEEAIDAIAVIRLDTLEFLDVNRALSSITGYERSELLRMSYADILAGWATARLDVAALRAGHVIREVQRYRRSDGNTVDVEVVAKRFDENRAQIIGRDMSLWKRTQEQLRESEARYARAVAGANDGLWDWDLRSSEIYFSTRWKQMLGYEEEDIGSEPSEWFSRVHPDDADKLHADIRAHILGDLENFEVEHRIEKKDGTWLWVNARGLAVRDEHGRAYRIAGSQTDIHERKDTEQKLYHNAFHDSLTGLPNRAFFINRLQVLLGDDGGIGESFAVLYMDLDRFKVINDSLGHVLGDQLLTDIAQRLRESLNSREIIARMGGDEFTVLVRNIIEKEEAVRVAESLLRAMQKPFFIRGREIVLSTSIGIAYSDMRRYHEAEEILRDADIAMYHAKERGKSRIEIFNHRLHHRAIRRMQLETDFRSALENDDLELYYQPIVHADTRRVTAFEALTRWKHPSHGNVSPAQFVPIAEETGMVRELGIWGLKKAVAQHDEWWAWRGEEGDLAISVNLSPNHFKRPNIVEEVLHFTGREKLRRGAICLEITESALVEETTANIRKIERLREEGFRVMIDDFGVGYSSFNYLVRLPVNAIKIDRSFIYGLEYDDAKFKVVEALVHLATGIGVDVVAEGVETQQQARILQELSSEMLLQGAYFSMPVPPGEASAFFDRDW